MSYPICDRCHKTVLITTGSMFNLEQICLTCDAIERKHPRYIEAREAELEAVKNHDYNFPGIGLPAELQGGKGGEHVPDV